MKLVFSWPTRHIGIRFDMTEYLLQFRFQHKLLGFSTALAQLEKLYYDHKLSKEPVYGTILWSIYE